MGYHLYSEDDLLSTIEITPGETIHRFCERAVEFRKVANPVELIVAKAYNKEIPVLRGYDADDLYGEFAAVLNMNTISEESKMEEKEPKLDIYNPEHYLDPTAYHAIKHAEPEDREGWLSPDEWKDVKERHHKLLGYIFRICELSGFTIENRIELRDNKTGRVWK